MSNEPVSQSVTQRRTNIGKIMERGIVKAADIASALNLDIQDVYNDLSYLKEESRHWLSGYANDGYVFITKQTIDELYNIEKELQSMRQKAKTTPSKLKIMRQLVEIINIRWEIQGNGPTLMNIKKYYKQKPEEKLVIT